MLRNKNAKYMCTMRKEINKKSQYERSAISHNTPNATHRPTQPPTLRGMGTVSYTHLTLPTNREV